MAGYEKFVKEFGINFEWKINKDTEKLEYRDLTGPEKLLLFQHINFHLLLPEFHDVYKLWALWGNFIDIIGDLKLNYTSDDAISNLKDKIKKWFQKFLDLYQAKDIIALGLGNYSQTAMKAPRMKLSKIIWRLPKDTDLSQRTVFLNLWRGFTHKLRVI